MSGEGRLGQKRGLSVNTNIVLTLIQLIVISNNYSFLIRLIPQVTVDNNLGPDRLIGSKDLNPNSCR